MPEYGYFLSRVMQPVTPTSGESGYFSSPEDRLDPKLFDGEKIRPEIRSWIVNTLYKYWATKYRQAPHWSTVWIAGSGISYQWAASRGNGDLDILIGVDYDDFFEANPEYAGFDQVDLSAIFNQQLHEDLWPQTAETHFKIGHEPWVGPRPESVRAADLSRSTMAASALSASGGTSGTGTSSGSTASRPKTTGGFWQNKMGTAPSAHEQNQEDRASSFMSTTTMNQVEFEGFSATDATATSDTSETTSPPSSASLSTSDEGVFETTWYVNPNSTDIRDINPYAAYDLSSDTWTVRPPEGAAFDHSPEYYKHAESEAQTARDLVTRYNSVSGQAKGMNPGSPGWHNAMKQAELLVSQAAGLYDSIHLGRKQAFAPGGSGYGDYYNFRWQYHKKQGTAQALHAVASAHHDALEEYQQTLYGGSIDAADVVLRRAVMHTRSM